MAKMPPQSGESNFDNPRPRVPHPCAGRSKTTIETFELIAIGQQPPYRPRTIATLLEAGLIEQVGEHVIGRDSLGSVKIPVYEVPLAIHWQWCQWCAGVRMVSETETDHAEP